MHVLPPPRVRCIVTALAGGALPAGPRSRPDGLARELSSELAGSSGQRRWWYPKDTAASRGPVARFPFLDTRDHLIFETIVAHPLPSVAYAQVTWLPEGRNLQRIREKGGGLNWQPSEADVSSVSFRLMFEGAELEPKLEA